MNHWDARFLDLARHVSTWSKDPSTKCGAVVTHGRNHIVSLGFNGFPPGIEDSPAYLSDRKTRLKLTRHAEENALFYAANSLLCPDTIYIYPIPPCARCTGAIIQAGISRIVSCIPDPERAERWADDFRLSGEMLEAADISLVLAPV